MHDDSAIILGRTARFLSHVLTPSLHLEERPLTVEAWAVGGEPVPFAVARDAPYSPLAIGDRWGTPWDTVWMHITGRVPTDWGADFTAAELVVDLGFNGDPGFQAEGLVHTADGTIVKAISPYNNTVPLAPGEAVDLYLEAAANPDIAAGYTFLPTRFGHPDTAGSEPLYELRRASACLRDVEAWELRQDVLALTGLAAELAPDAPRRAEIMRALDRMLDAVDPDDVHATVALGRAQLAPVLASPANASAHRIVAVGHAHIDSAWLWPVRETIRKCARTFSNVVALAEADPTFRFACSSAQQLAWIKQSYPELFERIRTAVARGQFIPVGGMWVEADTNMPGGESMARQFLEGKSFFLDEFGIDTQEVWLPDSFGYSAALPQIIAASGSRYFLTQKISWNLTNRMPHNTFRWEGIDGTRVFTHFPPVDTYNSDLSAKDLAHAQRNYREHGRGTTSLVPFGWGDGGGGPTREMLAAAKRARSLEGSPTVEIASPLEFFERAEAEYASPPVWSGELYLELHRGGYTSQLRTKQGNRRSEHLLREAELWAATATVRLGAEYPAAQLRELWQLVLLQQFHDILPGSSIAWVHRDAERNYAAIAEKAERIIGAALGALTGEGDRKVEFNATPHARANVPALGAAAPGAPSGAATAVRTASGIVLENGLIRAVIDSAGQIASLHDLASGREAIAPGERGNRLQLHRDIPNMWDAWDIDEHYRNSVVDLDDEALVEIIEREGSAVVRVRRSVGASTIDQELRLEPGSLSLEIRTDVDWHERQKLLKLGFALDVHAEHFSAETQFGHVRRPTHVNTSWDAARFEVSAHRWVHIGEPGYGVAIANDSTYGHDVTTRDRNGGGTVAVVRLSLLRAPLYPDPGADQGPHTMIVTVRPGADISAAVEEGYRVNLARRVVVGAHDVEPLVRLEPVGAAPARVLVEAVKLAHDDSGDVIVRLYESEGARGRVRLEPGMPWASAASVDLLERADGRELDVDARGMELDVRPFEIVTLRIVRLSA